MMDISEILKRLPHRYPFVLVDRVLELDLKDNEGSFIGSRIKTQKNITYNEPFFPGHFPGRPIMPGVLIIEAMAQSAGLLIYRPPPKGREWEFYICGVNDAKFRKTVTPGDTLEINALTIKDKSTFFVFSCEARVDEQVVASAEIMAKIL